MYPTNSLLRLCKCGCGKTFLLISLGDVWQDRRYLKNHKKVILREVNRDSKSNKRLEILNNLISDSKNKCGYCGIDLYKMEIHIDHIIPRCKGGTDDFDNLIVSCNFCNMAKQDLEAIAFLNWLSHIRSSKFDCKIIRKIKSLEDAIDPIVFDRLQKSWIF